MRQSISRLGIMTAVLSTLLSTNISTDDALISLKGLQSTDQWPTINLARTKRLSVTPTEAVDAEFPVGKQSNRIPALSIGNNAILAGYRAAMRVDARHVDPYFMLIRDSTTPVNTPTVSYSYDTQKCIESWASEQNNGVAVSFDTPPEDDGTRIEFEISGPGASLAMMDQNYREIHRVVVTYTNRPKDNEHLYATVLFLDDKMAYWKTGQEGSPEDDRYSALTYLGEQNLKKLAGKLAVKLNSCVGSAN